MAKHYRKGDPIAAGCLVYLILVGLLSAPLLGYIGAVAWGLA